MASSSTLVLDASITLSWAFQDENNPYAEHTLDYISENRGLAPVIWPLEVSNALLSAERRGRISQVTVMQFFSFLWRLHILIETEQTELQTTEIMDLARLYHLSAYDAAYLHQALRHGCPLATNDRTMRQAAEQAGVSLFGENF